MHTIRPRTTALLSTLLAATAAAAPQELQARDHKELAKHIEEYLDPKTEPEEQLEVKQELTEALEKIGKRLVEKGEDPLQAALALTADLGRAYQQAVPLKAKRGGTAYDSKVEFREEAIAYKLWVPPSYKHSGDPTPVILVMPGLDEEGQPMAPGQFLTEHWMETVARESALIAALELPEDQDSWDQISSADGKAGGAGRVMLVMRDLRDNYLVDFDRVYLLGRGAAVPAAVSIGGMFPHLFAGVVGQAGDAGEAGAGNYSNLPTFFQGGGAEASAFSEAAADFGNCTLKPEASEDDVWTWMQEHPRSSNPAKVTLVAGKPIPNKAYWVEIPPVASEGGVVVTAEADRESNTVTVSGTGASTVTLFFNDQLVDLDKPIKLVLNGAEQEVVVPRSVDDLLRLIERGTSDPGKLYVASATYDLP